MSKGIYGATPLTVERCYLSKLPTRFARLTGILSCLCVGVLILGCSSSLDARAEYVIPITHDISAIALSPDGVYVAVGTENRVQLFLLDGMREIWSVETADPTSSLAFSSDQPILTSGNWDTIIFWDLTTGVQLDHLPDCSSDATIADIVFDEDKQMLACAAGSAELGTLDVWDTDTKEHLRALREHRFSIDSISLSPAGILATSSINDRKVILWDIDSGEPLYRLEGHEGGITDVAFSPDGGLLASGSGDSTVILWDVATGQSTNQLEGLTGGVRSIAWSSDGSMLAVGSRLGVVIVWDMTTGQVLLTPEGQTDAVADLAFTPDGETLVSVTWSGNIVIWPLVP